MAWNFGRLIGRASDTSAGHKTIRPASPWAESGQMAAITMADYFGTDGVAVTRLEAMQVPAVAMARWLICTQLSAFPLRVYSSEDVAAAEAAGVEPAPIADTPEWLTRTDGQQSPQLRMAWTLDDLMFTGYSLWTVERDEAGDIQSAERVPLEWWGFTPEYDIELQGEPASSDEVLLFVSAHDPLLEIGARTIRAAHKIENAWTQRVEDPIPVMEIRQTQPLEGLSEEELDKQAADVVKAYLAARRKKETANAAFSPYGYEMVPHGQAAPDLYENGRNAVAIDLARFVGLPAASLDASPVQASLTYSTQEAGRSDLEDLGLAGWALAIQSRLSMDDCVPKGQSVLFDRSFARTPTADAGPIVED